MIWLLANCFESFANIDPSDCLIYVDLNVNRNTTLLKHRVLATPSAKMRRNLDNIILIDVESSTAAKGGFWWYKHACSRCKLSIDWVSITAEILPFGAWTEMLYQQLMCMIWKYELTVSSQWLHWEHQIWNITPCRRRALPSLHNPKASWREVPCSMCFQHPSPSI